MRKSTAIYLVSIALNIAAVVLAFVSDRQYERERGTWHEASKETDGVSGDDS